jgi:beta-N-acetylhexosaminidase
MIASCMTAYALLTVEEKVGQLLMVHVQGEVAGDEARALIQEAHVGGIIYYNWANGLQSPERVRALSAGLQSLAKIPLLIAADQEGGVVSRLPVTPFPGARAVAETKNPELARRAAEAMGQEMLSLGVNMNLAPVVDINQRSVIGIRSFGDDPEQVCTYGAATLEGYAVAGVLSTLKHYPGHGNVQADSHLALPVLSASLEDLEACDLIPFARLAQKADAIMTAHLLATAFDRDSCVTLSPCALQYLREKIGFSGVIISDSLVMRGVLDEAGSVEEAALRAFEAGCDILLLGGKLLQAGDQIEMGVEDVQRVHGALVQAVLCGRISEARLNESVERICRLKQKIQPPCSPPEALCAAALAREIAELSQEQQKPYSLEGKSICLIAPQALCAAVQQVPFLQLGASVEACFFPGLDPTIDEQGRIVARAQEKEVTIILSSNAWKHPQQECLIQSILNTWRPLLLAATRDPTDLDLFPCARRRYALYSPTLPALEVLCSRLSSP